MIIVRGTGAAFCAGLDLRELAAQREAGEADLGGLEHVLEDLEACPQPTIAAVQGDAVAGGCELALHCDLRVAADTARFSMPLARIGLAVPGDAHLEARRHDRRGQDEGAAVHGRGGGGGERAARSGS